MRTISLFKSKIERSHELGAECKTIAKALKIAPSTVQYTLNANSRHTEAVTQPRSERPKSYKERDQRRIIHFVRVNPKSNYADIKRNLQIYLFYETLGRILDTIGIKNWRAKGRLVLDSADTKIRCA